jgi:hypothetical protein
MPAGKRLDGEGCGRAGSEPDDHAVLDQLHRCLRGRAPEGAAVGVGLGSRRAHDRAAAALALARMFAIAAA